MSDSPSPVLWLKILVWIFASFQILFAALIIVAYFKIEKFRKHPGTIIVGFAVSALLLSILWASNFQKFIRDSEILCAWIGFLAIYLESNCIFYELGILYYFVCYFKVVSKPFIMTEFLQEFHERKNSGVTLDKVTKAFRNEVDVVHKRIRTDADPGPQVEQNEDKGNSNTREQQPIILNEMDPDPQQRFQKELIQVRELVNEDRKTLDRTVILLQQTQEVLDEIFDYTKKNAYSAMNVQGKIHWVVLITSLVFTLIPTLNGELGLDYYGACSKEWEPTLQSGGIIFTVIVAAMSALASGMVLADFVSKKKAREHIFQVDEERRILPVQEDHQMARRGLTEEEQHYLKHLWVYVILITILSWLLAASNIYADKVTVIEEDSWITQAFFILHFLMIAFQMLVILLLKVTEPSTWRAITQAINCVPREGDRAYQRL